MDPYIVAILLVWAHFIGDFILQSDYHAINKSKSNWVLLQHVFWYSVPFAFLSLIVPLSLTFILLNFVLHAIVDYVSSRITSYLWKNDKRHWFFVTIGADQSLHFTCLFLSYYYLHQIS